jgi:hypothetical protein
VDLSGPDSKDFMGKMADLTNLSASIQFSHAISI